MIVNVARMASVLCLLAAVPAVADKPQASPWSQESIDASVKIKARAAEIRVAPAERGCLGKDAVTCIASIGQYLLISSAVSGGYGELKLPKPVERDIYGKARAQSVDFLVIVPIVGKPDQKMTLHASLFLSDGEHVSGVMYEFANPPLLASTEEQWNATGAYELAVSVLGFECIGTDRIAFYRFYDEIQKSAGVSTDFDGSLSNPGVTKSLQGSRQKCGAELSAITTSSVSVEYGSTSGSSLYIGLPKASGK